MKVKFQQPSSSSGQSTPGTNYSRLYHKHKTDKKASVMHRYGIISAMLGDNGSTMQTTLPEADLVHQQCQAAQARHHFFRGPTETPGDLPQPVVVAVSGGADSVALLHVLHRYCTLQPPIVKSSGRTVGRRSLGGQHS